MCTFPKELGGLLGLHHGLVTLCCSVPEEGCRHIALLHVHYGLGHCTAHIAVSRGMHKSFINLPAYELLRQRCDGSICTSCSTA